MSRPIITLTTDFGLGSSYVAQMKGAILSICGDAEIVDITHAVPPQDILSGAITLRDATRHFPPGSIHIGVVDPGVGSTRQIIYLEANGQRYIGPDNGLFSLLDGIYPPAQLIAVTNRELCRAEVSATFHGRDIMAPVAAHLANGLNPSTLGPSISEMIRIEFPQPSREASWIRGRVLYCDSFGNAITNIAGSDLAAAADSPTRWEFEMGSRIVQGLSRTYADRASGEFIALVGSSGYLELSRVNGSAANTLGLRGGEPVTAKLC